MSKTIGHQVGDSTEVSILNSVMSITQDASRLKRRSRSALHEFRSITTHPLGADRMKKCGHGSARVNFFAQDQMDISFAAKEHASMMSNLQSWGEGQPPAHRPISSEPRAT